MSGEIPSANMLMPVPGVGVTSGPQWATDIDNCLTIIDFHDHSPGYGVQINPAGININGPLTFNSNSATTLLSAQFVSQMSGVVGASELYVLNGDLYYNNGAGTPVQVTVGGSIVGTTGSISGLVSPASASYVSGDQALLFKADATTYASINVADVILHLHTSGSNGLTLSPPAPMSLSYTLTLPIKPVSATSFMTMDTSGFMYTNTTIDGVTLVNTSNVIHVGAGSIGSTQLSTAINTAINLPRTLALATFNASDNWTAPADCTTIVIEGYGGGGGGGDGDVSSGGGGGGGGNMAYVTSLTVVPLTVYAVTIGAGGAHNANGSVSSLGSLITFRGGSAGSVGAGGPGGRGGIGPIDGGRGGKDSSPLIATVGMNSIFAGGNAGSTISTFGGGGGGGGGVTAAGGNGGDAGVDGANAAANSGAGGGGGGEAYLSHLGVGGTGGSGRIKITYAT